MYIVYFASFLLAFVAAFIIPRLSDRSSAWSRSSRRILSPPSDSKSYHSCTHCSTITISWPSRPIDEWGYNHQLNITLSQARKAANEGCELFRMLYDETDIAAVNRSKVFWSLLYAGQPICFILGLRSVWQRWWYLSRSLGRKPIVLHFRPVRFQRKGQEQPSALSCRIVVADRWNSSLEVFAEKEDPMFKHVSYHPVGRDVASAESFAYAKSWLNDCLGAGEKHSQCKVASQSDSSIRPARLVEVSSDRSDHHVKLHCTNETEKIEWGTLSYCWGGDQTGKLTIARLPQYTQKIQVSSLSATLRDAIRVAQGIGMRYIWIDALCIIQDCQDDKLIELAKMPKIYEMSMLTISASSASTSAEGFLQTRKSIAGQPIRLRTALADGSRGNILLCRSEQRFGSTDEPVNQRAWCFQERLLSHRILDYGTRSLQWACRSQELQMGGAFQLSEPGLDGSGGRGMWQTRYQDPRFQDLLQTVESKRVEIWGWIVRIYSSRKITFTQDRPIALAGIAEEYASRFNLTYMAGLWHEDLSQLLWWRTMHSGFIQRPDTYSGPTWSWFATTSDVEVYTHSRGSMQCKIISCTVRPAKLSLPFGATRSGQLVLRGQMVKATWVFGWRAGPIGTVIRPYSTIELDLESGRDKLVVESSYDDTPRSRADGKTIFHAMVSEDYYPCHSDEGKESVKDIYCLKVWTKDRMETTCLMLESDHSGQMYERCGLLVFGFEGNLAGSAIPVPQEDVFGSMAEQEVVIC